MQQFSLYRSPLDQANLGLPLMVRSPLSELVLALHIQERSIARAILSPYRDLRMFPSSSEVTVHGEKHLDELFD